MDQHICIHTSCYVSRYHAYILDVYYYNGRERRDEEALITLFYILFFPHLLCAAFSLFIIFSMTEALMELTTVWDVLGCLREYIICIDVCLLAAFQR